MKREELLRILRDEETEVENGELLLSIFSTYGWSYYEGAHVFAHGESQSSRFSSRTGLPTGKLVTFSFPDKLDVKYRAHETISLSNTKIDEYEHLGLFLKFSTDDLKVKYIYLWHCPKVEKSWRIQRLASRYGL